MGTVNYTTSKYITMGIRPHENADYYEDDYINAENIIDNYNIDCFTLSLCWGYYEGVQLLIDFDYLYFDDYHEKQEAQKEVTQLKNLLLDLAGVGFVACFPSWVTGYRNYLGTIDEIKKAVKEMRRCVKDTPTYNNYRKGARA